MQNRKPDIGDVASVDVKVRVNGDSPIENANNNVVEHIPRKSGWIESYVVPIDVPAKSSTGGVA